MRPWILPSPHTLLLLQAAWLFRWELPTPTKCSCFVSSVGRSCPSERHERRTLVVYPHVAADSWRCHQPAGARGCWSCCEEQTASSCLRAVLLLPVPRRCGSCVQPWLAPRGCLRGSSSLFTKGGGRPGQAQEARWVSRTSPCSSGLPARTVPALCQGSCRKSGWLLERCQTLQTLMPCFSPAQGRWSESGEVFAPHFPGLCEPLGAHVALAFQFSLVSWFKLGLNRCF